MEWYWWLCIAAALAGFVILKVKLGGRFLASMKRKQEDKQRAEEEDE